MTAGSRRARSDGLGSLFIGGAGVLQCAGAGLVTLAAAFLSLGTKGAYCSLVAYFFTWGMKAWFHGRIGGVTGDVIGCVSELNEIVCLMVIAAMFGNR